MRGLAYRRHQWSRAKLRALRYLRWILQSEPRFLTPRQIARFAIDRVPCSCPMCGNPRRFTGEVTRQELRAECRCEEPDP